MFAGKSFLVSHFRSFDTSWILIQFCGQKFLKHSHGYNYGKYFKIPSTKIVLRLNSWQALFASFKSVHRGPEKILIFETNFRGYRIFS